MLELGLRPSLARWIANFLSDRSQCVRYHGSLSDSEKITCGLPQGTLLGPWIFIAYINGAAKHASTKRWKFVDDLNLLEVRPLNAPSTIQQDLADLQRWSSERKMALHPKKCKVMHFLSAKSHPPLPKLTINDLELQNVSTLKILGIHIQSKLKWSEQVVHLCKKASQRLFLLRRLKNSAIPPEELTSIFTIYIRPTLEYAAPVWHSGLTGVQSKAIERVQRRAVRIILGRDFTTYRDACSRLGLPLLSSRRENLTRAFATSLRRCNEWENCKPPKATTRMFYYNYSPDNFLQISNCCHKRDSYGVSSHILRAKYHLLKGGHTAMLACTLLILGPLWIHTLTHASQGDELPREVVLAWFKERILEGLGLEEPPLPNVQGPDGGMAQAEARQGHRRSSRTSRTAWVDHRHNQHQENPQIILFPSSDSSCARSDPVAGEPTTSYFTYYFQPSMNSQESLVTSAHFWFYAGEGATTNSSAQLFILTSEKQLLEAPSKTSSDGWITYHLEQNLQASVSEGPFVLQVRCPTCQCHSDEPDKMPFLHLHTQPRGTDRSPRNADTTIPWAPSAINLLQRPSQEKLEHSDCHRAMINISFEELGWGNWIIHPKVLTFHYCHGNCSAWDRTTTMLGIKQCCAPVPGTMKSLRITTTSDGGYSFKYETLPNIIPEECTCI
ncbi:inhibin alpha chain [Diretmus argenteus]